MSGQGWALSPCVGPSLCRSLALGMLLASLSLSLSQQLSCDLHSPSCALVPTHPSTPTHSLQCDLPDTRVDKEQLDAFCKEHGFIGWLETSAKTNHNIEEAVRGLVSNILTHPDAFEAQRLSAQSQAAAAASNVSLTEKKDEDGGAAGGGSSCC